MNPLQPGQRLYQKTTAHVYTELAKTALGNTELYNLYGIVVDCTSSHKKDGKSFKTHIRIIDPSLQSGTIMITMFANSPEQLPTFKKVGEIIRFHRCNIGNYMSHKTFCVNMAYGSSWVIFEGMPSNNVKKPEIPQEEEQVELSSGDLVGSDSEVDEEPDSKKEAIVQ